MLAAVNCATLVKHKACDHGTSVGDYAALNATAEPYHAAVGGSANFDDPKPEPPGVTYSFGNNAGFDLGGAIGIKVTGY